MAADLVPNGESSFRRLADGTFEYVRTFTSHATSPFAVESILLSQESIGYGLPFKDLDDSIPDPNVRVREIVIEPRIAKRLGKRGLYDVTVQYGQLGGEVPIPDGPAVWVTEDSLQEQDADIDRHGAAVANSAGVPFDDAPQKLVPDEIATATWIVTGETQSSALAAARDIRGKLNSAPWQNAGPREALCLTITPTVIQGAAGTGDTMIRFVARFHFKPSKLINGILVPGWDLATPDRGRDIILRDEMGNPVIEGGVLKRQAITRAVVGEDGSITQEPVDTPVLLDGAGNELPDGADPVALIFEMQDEYDFNNFTALQ